MIYLYIIIMLTYAIYIMLYDEFTMTEFDRKLNNRLHSYTANSKKSFYEIANECGIPENRLYRFTAQCGPLNADETYKLMNYLNLTVELKEKS